MPSSDSVGAWLFQANETYNLREQLLPGKVEDWTVGQLRQSLREGHAALLWQSGEERGIYGFGRLIGEPYERDGAWWIDIEYIKLLERPISDECLKTHQVLKDLGILKMPRGKNPYRITDDEWKALSAWIGWRGSP